MAAEATWLAPPLRVAVAAVHIVSVPNPPDALPQQIAYAGPERWIASKFIDKSAFSTESTAV